MDTDASIFYHPSPETFNTLAEPADWPRILSDPCRELCVFASMIQLFPRRCEFLAEVIAFSQQQARQMEQQEQQSVEAGEGEAVTDLAVFEPTPISTEAVFFNKIFASYGDNAITFTALIAGTLTIEKIALIDSLIDCAVSSIIIAGELALPFLVIQSNGRVQFTNEKYFPKFLEFSDPILHLYKKAKMRGVSLMLPADVVVSEDDMSSDTMKARSYEKVDSDSRDEGLEFEGDKTTVSLIAALQNTVSESTEDESAAVANTVEIRGSVYDIGEETTQTIVSTVSESTVFLQWGTVGLCECSAFQAGQKAVTAAVAKPAVGADTEAATPITNPPLYSIVIGDSTVEWYARFVDSDGELGGDLARAGRLSLASRASAPFLGLLTKQKSHALLRVVQRPPSDAEFIYYNPIPASIEEEEEEEEDEDDE